MAMMFALNKILLPGDEEVAPRTVFEATPGLAKQLMQLKSARNATAAEIAAAQEAQKAETGTAFEPVKKGDAKVIATGITPTPDAVKPDSGAKGDPQSAPKGKTD